MATSNPECWVACDADCELGPEHCWYEHAYRMCPRCDVKDYWSEFDDPYYDMSDWTGQCVEECCAYA